MDENEQQLRIRVTAKIEEVELAVESLQGIRKSLLQNAYETKRSILEAFINQRDSMQSREMVLLGKVDVLLQSKDDALVTQLSKLNQVLGCLRNCLQSEHPCGDCLEKYDDLDLDPVADMSMEFKSASDILTRAIDCYGQLSGDTPSASPATAPTTNEETDSPDSPSVTQWLLTPTNVKRKATEKASAGTNEIMSTEWLLAHHSTSPSTAITAGKLFTEVRGADRDCWLRPDTAAAHSSLYSHTADHFSGLQEDTHNDWLLPEAGEADSVHEEASSCASSSCVVIPSARASECSSYVMANSWLQHAQLPPLSHHVPYAVKNWVASCQPAESRDWLVSSRWQRLTSTSSFCSDIHQLHLVENHWLSGKDEQPYEPYEPETDGWLVSGESERVDENRLMSTELPEWLPIPKKLQLAQYDFGGEEKHDNAAEKHSHSSDWMTLSMAGGQQWLQKDTGSSDVGFADKRMAVMSRSADRDWLVVVNTLNQIAGSDQSGWLVG